MHLRGAAKIPGRVLRLGYKVPAKVLSYGYKDVLLRPKYHGYRLRAKPYAHKSVPHECAHLLSAISGSTRHQVLPTGDFIYRIDVHHPHAIDGCRILHLSDLHLGGKETRKIAAAHKALEGEEFDVVVLTGDILHKNHVRLCDQERAFLRSLRSRHGAFYVYGDHERMGKGTLAGVDEQLRGLGLVNLTNKALKLRVGSRTLTILGFDDIKLGKVEYAAARALHPGDFNVALMHNLDALTSEVPHVIDLALSGHLHAGELSFGVVDGGHFMRLETSFHNLNGHHGTRTAFKFLTARTLSYSNPGFASYLKETLRVPRIYTRRQGIAVLTLRRA